MKNAHGRTCKKTKVYIYLYISPYENVFENGCIYIYIYVKYESVSGKMRRVLAQAFKLIKSNNVGNFFFGVQFYSQRRIENCMVLLKAK